MWERVVSSAQGHNKNLALLVALDCSLECFSRVGLCAMWTGRPRNLAGVGACVGVVEFAVAGAGVVSAAYV